MESRQVNIACIPSNALTKPLSEHVFDMARIQVAGAIG